MEVSAQYEDKDTHAIVGSKGQAKQFSISTTPEFIEVLSSSLYPNKPLAVVREVICNAWDAHIAAGKTNIPLNITITDNTFTVQDFGNGIPEDAIEDVYCTYGESTKLKAHDLTGGFGLGTKAPFAISDTFTVINSNNGSRVVYSASKGNDDTDGLPALYEMVRVPSTDTGMTIKVPILPELRDVIYGLAKKVCFNGEIKAKIFNDTAEYKVTEYEGTELGLKDSEAGFVVTSINPTYGNPGRWRNSNILFIQYGTVIYPIQIQNEYEQEWASVAKIINKQINHSNTYIAMSEGYLVLKAEPNTLNVAPSREELSYGKLTNTTIKNLLYAFLNKHKEITKQCIIDANLEVRNRVMAIWDHDDEGKSSELKATQVALDFDSLKFNKIIRNSAPTTVNTIKEFQQYFMLPRHNISNSLYKSMIIKAMMRECKKKKYYTALKFFKKWNLKLKSNYYAVVRKYITNKWMRKLAEKFDPGILKYIHYYSPGNYPEWIKITSPHAQWERTKFDPLTVVISNNKSSIRSYNFGKYDNITYAVIILPKNQKKYDIDEVTEFLQKHVYNLHAIHSLPEYQPVKSERKNVQPRKKGYAKLSACLTATGHYSHSRFEDAERIEKPTAVACLRVRQHRYVIDSAFDNNIYYIKHFLNVFPDTVVVTSRATGDRLRNKYNINYIDSTFYNWKDSMSKLDSVKEELAKFKANELLQKPFSVLKIPEIASEVNIDQPYQVKLSESQIWLLLNKTSMPFTEEISQLANKYASDHQASSLVTKLRIIDSYYLDNFINLSADDQANVIKMILAVIKG